MHQNLRLNKLLFFIIILFFTVSCKNKKTNNNILSQSEFISILVDVHLANATLNYMQADKNWKNFNAKDYYPSILKKHKITSKELERTIQYYIKEPKMYESVYDSVINRLSIMQGDITNKIIQAKK